MFIEELSWKRVNRVRNLRRNQLIDARIVDVDPENRQITLSPKQMEENPWEQAQKPLEVEIQLMGMFPQAKQLAFIEPHPNKAFLPFGIRLGAG